MPLQYCIYLPYIVIPSQNEINLALKIKILYWNLEANTSQDLPFIILLAFNKCQHLLSL